MIVLALALAILIAIVMALWQIHWFLGLTAAVLAIFMPYASVMDNLGRKLTGHRRDCTCPKCWPSGHDLDNKS